MYDNFCFMRQFNIADHLGSSGLVQEIPLTSPTAPASFLDAPVIAGCISALLLATAVIICVCVALTRRHQLFHRRSADTSTQSSAGDGIESKRSSEKNYACLTGTTTKGRKESGRAMTPIKRSKCRSMASLASSQNTLGEDYEIYPYATFA